MTLVGNPLQVGGQLRNDPIRKPRTEAVRASPGRGTHSSAETERAASVNSRPRHPTPCLLRRLKASRNRPR